MRTPVDAQMIAASRVVTPGSVHEPGWVEVVGDRVSGVGEGAPPRRPERHLTDRTLVPGFVDAHVHGGGGRSYTDGHVEAAATAAHAHLSHGTTTTMASLVTASIDELERAIRALAPLVDEGVLAGVHLEGPWLSPEHRGAHEARLLRPPTPADVDRLLSAGSGRVRMVTLAPELPGGLPAVPRILAHGAVVAVGHTDATYAVTRAALDAGASVGTHLFNAMRPVHHREPGPVVALLEDATACVELIADGVHLHPSVLSLASRTAGPGRTVLVTDAMAAAAGPDGDYGLGGLLVHVRGREARLASTGAIAGSTLTMSAAVRHAVQVARLSLPDAVRAATTTPATMLGLNGIGALQPGYRADMLALDSELRVVEVMRRGAWLRPEDVRDL